MAEKVRILFISGSGRSGTTIIQRILDQVEGFSAVGEVCFLWERGLIQNKYCGCMKAINNCEYWRKILDSAFGNVKGIDAEQMNFYFKSGARYHQLPRMMIPGAQKRIKKDLRAYIKSLEKLYQAIKNVGKAEIIVDSSKFPSYGYIIGLIPNVELYVLHLVRDSRAVAFSWLRKKESQPGVQMLRFNPVISALSWDVYNFSTEFFWGRKNTKYLRMRYEDFIKNPKTSISSILTWLNIRNVKLPFVSKEDVNLEISHSVAGNPNRFSTGKVKLFFDNEWEESMGIFNKSLTTILTLPYLIKYRYL